MESQISDRSILSNYLFGHSVKKDDNGNFIFSNKDSDVLAHQAPELLFLERCLDWLKPGGRIGIVLPKGIPEYIINPPHDRPNAIMCSAVLCILERRKNYEKHVNSIQEPLFSDILIHYPHGCRNDCKWDHQRKC